MIRAHWLIALWIGLPASAADPQATDNWVCVPGDGGRWRCGQGSKDPQTSPLPELPTATAGRPVNGAPERNPPSIFVLDRPPAAQPTTLQPQAASQGPSADPLREDRNAGFFALKIASVSAVEEIPGFVESFGLDPTLVRYVRIDEGGSRRQVILWGEFSSIDQARRAVAGLPSVVRSMRPQVVRADGFQYPAQTIGQAPERERLAAATPANAPLKDRPAEAAQVAAAEPRANAPVPITIARSSGESGPPSIGDAAIEKGPAESIAAPAEAERVPAAPRAIVERATEPPEDPALDIQATAPGGNATSGSTRPDVAKPALQRRPASPNTAGALPAQERAATAATSVAKPSVESAQKPAAKPQRTVPKSLAVAASPGSPAPEANPPPIRKAPARRPTLGSKEFLALDGKGYTVQLTSLANPALIDRYLAHHGLDPGSTYQLSVDEGAGVRWLLLWGAYRSLESAEEARKQLPGSVRSPWVRRLHPLQELAHERP